MPRLAFLTLEDRSEFVIDDELAIAELARRGIHVEEIPWRRKSNWRMFDGVVIRTTWDYQRDVDLFLSVLDHIEGQGVPLANPAAFVRWNARKTYLRDLAEKGVVTVPTRWGHGLSLEEIRGLPTEFDCHECVLKPVVGANADDAFRVIADIGDEQATHIVGRFKDRDWMAQPFVESVLTEGEFSLFFFEGKLSHAVTKVPKSGDFRVQEEHGGVITALVADDAMRSAANRVIAAVGTRLLQARVDLVRLADGNLALMELEAIEPSLYFRMHPHASRNFAGAVERWFAAQGKLPH